MEDESAAQGTKHALARDDLAPVPRLSIGHLLLMTATCGLSVAVARLEIANPQPNLFSTAWYLLALVQGVSIMGALLVLQVVRRTGLQFAPGHVLLLLHALEGIIQGILVFLFGGECFPRLPAITFTRLSIGALCFAMMLHRWRNLSAIWINVFICFICIKAISGFLFFYLFDFGRFILEFDSRLWSWMRWDLAASVYAGLLVLATLDDRRKKVPRDWLHYLGAVLYAAHLVVLDAFQWLAVRFPEWL